MREITEKTPINSACEYFKQNLIDVINESKLPSAIIYYIMKDIFMDVERQYYGSLNSESPLLKEEEIEDGDD